MNLFKERSKRILLFACLTSGVVVLFLMLWQAAQISIRTRLRQGAVFLEKKIHSADPAVTRIYLEAASITGHSKRTGGN